MTSVMRNNILLIFSFWCFQTLVAGQALPSKPSTLVNDYVGLLKPQERQALENKLVSFDDSTSTQIAIAIESSLQGQDAFDRSFQIAQAWGVGGQENNNGILIYLAIEDRKIRIQTGYGAEGFLPDALARRIIEVDLRPAFQQGQFYQGLDRATDRIIKAHAGEYKAPTEQETSDFWPVLIFLAIMILIIWLSYKNRHKGGGYYRGGRYERHGDWWVFPTGGSKGGWGSGGGWGGGGGGFGGFGGGSFGGGGAGGDW